MTWTKMRGRSSNSGYEINTLMELLLQSAWRIKIYVSKANQRYTKLSNNLIKTVFFYTETLSGELSGPLTFLCNEHWGVLSPKLEKE